MRMLAHRIVHARMFDYFLVLLIVGTSVLLGVSTSDVLFDRFEDWIVWFVIFMLLVLVLEVFLKMLAVAPRVHRYFRDPWNVFDFLVIHFRHRRYCSLSGCYRIRATRRRRAPAAAAPRLYNH